MVSMDNCHLFQVYQAIMSSYEFVSDTTTSTLNPNWDLDLLDMISEHVHTVHPHDSENFNFQQKQCQQHVQMKEYRDDIMQTYVHARAAPTPSPSWDSSLDGGIPPAPTSEASISTYFSTFDPATQIQMEFPQVSVPMMTQFNIGTEYKNRALGTKFNVSTTSMKKSMKKKRKRTIFSTEQVAILEQVFSTKPYVTREDRKILVEQLNLSDKSVKVWFQNRRLKGKKVEEENSATLSEVDLDRLDEIEFKIRERTNELGFVTLDDKILEELAGMIETYLTKTPSQDFSEAQNVEVGPIYEPISPASPY